MKADDNLIKYLECLSNLALDKIEKERLKEDLSKILTSLACLNQIDTGGIKAMTHIFDNAGDLRADIVEASIDRELLLESAPSRDEEAYLVPKAVD